MSKLSTLQQIFPQTFYEGWNKAISSSVRDIHSTSTIVNSSLYHSQDYQMVYVQWVMDAEWLVDYRREPEGCSVCSLPRSYLLFGMTAWFQSVSGCLSSTECIHSKILTALKPPTAHLV